MEGILQYVLIHYKNIKAKNARSLFCCCFSVIECIGVALVNMVVHVSGVQFYNTPSVHRIVCSPPKVKSPSVTLYLQKFCRLLKRAFRLPRKPWSPPRSPLACLLSSYHVLSPCILSGQRMETSSTY